MGRRVWLFHFFLCLIAFIIFSASVYAAVDGGTSALNAPLITGSSTSINIQMYGTLVYFKFIPSETATYTITTDSAHDPVAWLYTNPLLRDEDVLAQSDDGNGTNPVITWALTKDTVYYLKIYDCEADHTCTLSITGGGLRGNNYPYISITNPAVDRAYKDSQTISISGTASDSDGDTVKVSASINGQSASTTVSGGSWTLTWSTADIAVGTYIDITVTADDGVGGTNTAIYTGDIVVDKTAPSGYSVNISQTSINNSNKTALSFTFADAESGTTYTYSFDDTNGTTSAVTGSGTITTATDQINNINVSGLDDETLTLTVYLTDTAGNQGTSVTDTVSKDTTAPSGYSVNISQTSINNSNKTALSFTFASAIVGTTYTYSIDDTNGTTSAVTGSGTITTATDQINNINVSGLDDGTLTLTVYLTDTAGNQGTSVTDTVSKDVTTPTVSSFSPVDGAENVVVTSDLVITFNETVTADTSGVTLYKSGSTTPVEYTMTGSGSEVITINPTSNLDGGSDYYVLIGSTAFKDAAGNYYAGISLDTTWNFTTATVSAPTITFNRPTDGNEYNINTGSMVIATLTDNGTGINNVTIQIDNATPVSPTKLVSAGGGTYKLYHVITGINYGTTDNSHTITILVTDSSGTVTSESITFTMKPKRKGFGFGRLRFD